MSCVGAGQEGCCTAGDMSESIIPIFSGDYDHHYLLFNQVLDLRNFLHSAVPMCHQDLARELSPCSMAGLIGIRRLFADISI